MSEIAPIQAAGEGGDVRRAIGQASRRTGVRFDYLLDQARRESGLHPDARASTSSAAGLYQFVEQTWLRLVHEQGHRHGMAAEARSIRFDGQRYAAASPAEQERILARRFDPMANALMAGEYARENHDRLRAALNRPIEKTDLALAHFLGGEGAVRFLTEMRRDPGQPGAALFPAAAGANQAVFHKPGGGARSLADIHAFFARQQGASPQPASAPTPAPRPGLGHFMAALPDGERGPMLSAPRLSGGSLWQTLTHPPQR